MPLVNKSAAPGITSTLLDLHQATGARVEPAGQLLRSKLQAPASLSTPPPSPAAPFRKEVPAHSDLQAEGELISHDFLILESPEFNPLNCLFIVCNRRGPPRLRSFSFPRWISTLMPTTFSTATRRSQYTRTPSSFPPLSPTGNSMREQTNSATPFSWQAKAEGALQ